MVHKMAQNESATHSALEPGAFNRDITEVHDQINQAVLYWCGDNFESKDI